LREPAAQFLSLFRSQLDPLTRHNQLPPIGTPTIAFAQRFL
jgi:hypothetical protein